VTTWFGSAVGWEAAWVLGGSGRESPAPTGDDVACGAGVGAGEGAGRISVVVGEAESRRGPSLRSG
jgi:hypothetical protein